MASNLCSKLAKPLVPGNVKKKKMDFQVGRTGGILHWIQNYLYRGTQDTLQRCLFKLGISNHWCPTGFRTVINDPLLYP